MRAPTGYFARYVSAPGHLWLMSRGGPEWQTVDHSPKKARPLASRLKRYAPRLISDHIMVQEDFERLHKFLLETEGLSEVSEDMRELVEDEGDILLIPHQIVLNSFLSKDN